VSGQEITWKQISSLWFPDKIRVTGTVLNSIRAKGMPLSALANRGESEGLHLDSQLPGYLLINKTLISTRINEGGKHMQLSLPQESSIEQRTRGGGGGGEWEVTWLDRTSLITTEPALLPGKRDIQRQSGHLDHSKNRSWI